MHIASPVQDTPEMVMCSSSVGCCLYASAVGLDRWFAHTACSVSRFVSLDILRAVFLGLEC
eukprot:14042872-Alexandrium_andersonii.AAC.1